MTSRTVDPDSRLAHSMGTSSPLTERCSRTSFARTYEIPDSLVGAHGVGDRLTRRIK